MRCHQNQEQTYEYIILSILDTVSDPALLRDVSTPQGQSVDWLISRDTLQVCPDNEKIVQRYVLALIYYSTNGVGWTQCSSRPGALDNCGMEFPFEGESRFLSPVNECQWAGIECNEDLCVTEIEFGAYTYHRLLVWFTNVHVCHRWTTILSFLPQHMT